MCIYFGLFYFTWLVEGLKTLREPGSCLCMIVTVIGMDDAIKKSG